MVSVTFDTNTLSKVVEPERYKKDKNYAAAKEVNRAISERRVQGYFVETVATIESVPRPARLKYFAEKASQVVTISEKPRSDGRIQSDIQIGGQLGVHPGIRKVLGIVFEKAFALGFKVIPSSRFGSVRPVELDLDKNRIPLPNHAKLEIWPFLQKISDISDAIEARGIGFSQIEKIASDNKRRLSRHDPYWAAGLNLVPAADHPKIHRAIAEWADGDTVALHIAYEVDVLCSEDKGRGGVSVFSGENRRWLEREYGIEICGLAQLHERVANAV